MSGHPFELTASQLQEILSPEDDPRLIMPPGTDAPPEVIATGPAGGTFLVDSERGQIPPPPEILTAEEIAEELGLELDELEEIAERLGIEAEEVTGLVSEEGGVGLEPDELPPDFPEPTGILAEQGGVVSEPLPLATTLAVGEEGGDLPLEVEDPNLILELDEELPEPTTLPLGEDGGMEPEDSPRPDFPPPTDILAEQGGVVSDPLPLATTEAVGEEGGGFTEVLSEQGEDPGFATTMAIGEEGGVITRADGEDGDTVFTFAEGENGEIMELGEPVSEMTPPGNVDDFEIAEVADMPTAGVAPDEFITDAFGEPGGFEADTYGQLYPELVDAVNSGVVPSLLDHYEAFGQFEPERIGIFEGNFQRPDRVTSFGNNTVISGIPIIGYDPIAGDFIFNGNGSGEFDVLIGESSMTSTELFILGNSQSQPFYVGSGDVDFALIQNFDVGSDRIQLPGVVEDYNFEIVDNSTRISTAAGDLVAVVENVSNIQDATLIFEG